MSLAGEDNPGALEALLRVAQQDTAGAVLGRAAGESVATILLRRGEVDDAPLAEFTGEAYLGFDETVARYITANGGDSLPAPQGAG